MEEANVESHDHVSEHLRCRRSLLSVHSKYFYLTATNFTRTSIPISPVQAAIRRVVGHSRVALSKVPRSYLSLILEEEKLATFTFASWCLELCFRSLYGLCNNCIPHRINLVLLPATSINYPSWLPFPDEIYLLANRLSNPPEVQQGNTN